MTGVSLTPTTGWGVLHLFCRLEPGFEPGRCARRSRLPRTTGTRSSPWRSSGTRRTSASWRSARTCGDCAGSRPRSPRPGRPRLILRLAHRGVRVRRRHPRRACARPASSRSFRPRASRPSASIPMSKRRAADATTGTRSTSSARKELMLGHGKVGRTFAGRILQVITGSDRSRRLGVGGHPLRRPPRRPEGLRLRDALRRGVGPLRRVRSLLHRHGRRRSTRCWTSSGHDAITAAAGADVRRRQASLDGPAALAAPARARRGGLQRRRRLRAGGHRWRTTRWAARPVLCATALSPSLAADEEEDCRALAAEWDLRWVGRPDRRDGRPGLRGQRRRPLRPLQDGAHGRARPAGRRRGGHGGAGGERERPRRPPPGQAAAAAAGAAFPLVEAGFTKATSALVRGSSACAPGTSPPPPAWPRACPTAPRSPSAALARSTRPSRPYAPSGSAQLRVRHHGDGGPARGRARRSAEVLARRERGRGGGARRPASVRGARSGGLPLGQP